VGADLDGLGAMVAIRRLIGELVLSVPGGMDPPAARFWRDHGAELGPLLSAQALEEWLERDDLGTLHIVDTARTERIGMVADHVGRFASVRVWDTHETQPRDLPSEVLPAAAATTSPLVLRLADAGQQPSPVEAGLFLLAIHDDTGNLTHPGTTRVDHEAAALCLRWGASQDWIATYLRRHLSRERLRLLSGMAESAQNLVVEGRSVLLATLELQEEIQGLAGLLDELRAAEGCDIGFLLLSDPRRISLIARSVEGVDVRPFLAPFGGGGHPSAGSASLRSWALADVRDHLIEVLAGQCRSAGDLATREIVDISMDDTVARAAQVLQRHRISSLPVVDEGRYAGLVSHREIDDAMRHGLEEQPVRSISAEPPDWVGPDADLKAVQETLIANAGRLVMVGSPPSQAVGVISRSDLFRVPCIDPPLTRSGQPPPARFLWKRAERLTAAATPHLERLGTLGRDLGLRVWLVGGSVRDLLLDTPLQDLDVVVEGDITGLSGAMVAALGGRVEPHQDFGTATLSLPDGIRIDLAQARAESYPRPGALPQVVPGSLHRDLRRRDFTINAMAMSLDPQTRGRLVDPFGGQADLKRRTLRVLHGLSFHDDPTRAFRAARFAARFDLVLAPGTRELMRQALAAGSFTQLSRERLGACITRILRERVAIRAVGLARDWGLLGLVHPALATDHELLPRLQAVREAWVALELVEGERAPDPSAALWIAVGYELTRTSREERARLRAQGVGTSRQWVSGPARVRKALRRLARAPQRSHQARVLKGLEPAELVCVLGVGGPESEGALQWWIRHGRHIKPALSGHDLIAAGFEAGPGVGDALQRVMDCAWNGGGPEDQWRAAREAGGPRP